MSYAGSVMALSKDPARPGITTARVCTIAAFVFAVLALLLSPVLFGIIGVLLGALAAYLGDKPLGWYGALASAVAALVSLLLNAIV
jgi:hypothetical protein